MSFEQKGVETGMIAYIICVYLSLPKEVLYAEILLYVVFCLEL
jgi:hypothetical protein